MANRTISEMQDAILAQFDSVLRNAKRNGDERAIGTGDRSHTPIGKIGINQPAKPRFSPRVIASLK